METLGWKTFMAPYYMHFHEGQQYWRHWAKVRRHSSKSCPARPILLTNGKMHFHRQLFRYLQHNNCNFLRNCEELINLGVSSFRCGSEHSTQTSSPQMTCASSTKRATVYTIRHRLTIVKFFQHMLPLQARVCVATMPRLCATYLMRYKSNCLQFTRLTWHQYLYCSYLN